ncbi:MAG TPA: acyloxyacyl hydrolase [Vicinamibacterales bacterium]|nr:acyloxyacyl hydrolase [Vicinamibacterales bacterium]
MRLVCPPRPRLSRLVLTAALAAVLLLVAPAAAHAGQQEPRLARGHETRALVGSVGQSWRFGWNDAGLSTSDVIFAGIHPQLGWFQTSRFELYGEGTLQIYWRPHAAVFAGLMGIGGRYHFADDRAWTPYALVSAGLGWTSLDIVEIDRVFNFQVVWGAGLRQITRRGPGWMIEFRNHHISNAGTRGENIGINSATLVAGVHWVLR